MSNNTKTTREESILLEKLKEYRRPVPEFFVHIAIEETNQGRIMYGPFKTRKWKKEDVPKEYQEGINCAPYSKKVHEEIESLIKKNYIIKKNDLLTISLEQP